MDISTNGIQSGRKRKDKTFVVIGMMLPLILCCCNITGLIFNEDISDLVNPIMGLDRDSNLIFILGLILSASLFLMLFPVALILFVQWRNTKTMDQIFEPLGLKGESYSLTGRQYHGVFNGRKIDIYILRGPTVEICCRGDIHTHFLAIKAGTVHSAVLENVREKPIRITETRLEDVIFYGQDETWLMQLFSDDLAVESLENLLSQGIDWAVFRRVEVKAGQASLTFYKSKKLMFRLALTSLEVKELLMVLSNLVESIEAAPNPAFAEEIPENSLENGARKIKPGIVALIIVLLVGMPACLITGGFLLTMILSGTL